MIPILIADDQDLVRGALAALLDTERDIEVVAECGRGDEVVDAVRAADPRPRVALLDIEMPGGGGIDAAAALHEADLGCRSLIVTTFGRPGYLRQALAAGVSGFLVKDTPPEQLAEAVRRVDSGLRVVDHTLAEESLFTPECPLTPRELEIVRAARDGASVREIASRVHLSPGTVRNHLSAVIGKTGTANRHAAVRRAEEAGWL
ncbi:MerR family transcriptional regulator [Corynebacterium frankenforstense DSM 45800]|uniref:MerR family transcriptional regulator n=1 Tax=Corynebacterium frankenforstense DSM 45800 TaxID=1437875 RepID=A0A1L7CQ70_9CORY|nr:response regulator transcription factor [Corynebacterium frankenforstense]APT87968.1 MerR family transcriptional regulator [Corynebacterium frankenforstense DSM 45800]